MQVVDDGEYIDILPVGGYLYVPMYDPYVVFARPRPGFFVGGQSVSAEASIGSADITASTGEGMKCL
jgi:hypothetical protein